MSPLIKLVGYLVLEKVTILVCLVVCYLAEEFRRYCIYLVICYLKCAKRKGYCVISDPGMAETDLCNLNDFHKPHGRTVCIVFTFLVIDISLVMQLDSAFSNIFHLYSQERSHSLQFKPVQVLVHHFHTFSVLRRICPV